MGRGVRGAARRASRSSHRPCTQCNGCPAFRVWVPASWVSQTGHLRALGSPRCRAARGPGWRDRIAARESVPDVCAPRRAGRSGIAPPHFLLAPRAASVCRRLLGPRGSPSPTPSESAVLARLVETPRVTHDERALGSCASPSAVELSAAAPTRVCPDARRRGPKPTAHSQTAEPGRRYRGLSPARRPGGAPPSLG